MLYLDGGGGRTKTFTSPVIMASVAWGMCGVILISSVGLISASSVPPCAIGHAQRRHQRVYVFGHAYFVSKPIVSKSMDDNYIFLSRSGVNLLQISIQLCSYFFLLLSCFYPSFF